MYNVLNIKAINYGKNVTTAAINPQRSFYGLIFISLCNATIIGIVEILKSVLMHQSYNITNSKIIQKLI